MTTAKYVNTLERLAVLVVAVVSIVFVYGMLSMALARDIPPPSQFNWIDSFLNTSEQPTFSKRPVESQEFDTLELETITEYTPVVFSTGLAMWKLFDGKLYPTLEACQAALLTNRETRPNQCVLLTGTFQP